MSRPAIKAAVAVALVIALGSCGGSSNAPTETTAKNPPRRLPLAAEERRVAARQLVQPKDLKDARAGSVRRAFLEYWSALENEEWSVALHYYPEQTQRRLGRGSLAAALRLEGAASTAVVKPLIRSVRKTRGNQTSVRYFLRRNDGTVRPTSMAWRKQDGRWSIVYSAALDDSYSSAVQEIAQTKLDPAAAQPSKDAVRAGRRALRAQAETLSRRSATKAPKAKSSPGPQPPRPPVPIPSAPPSDGRGGP